jgi:nucleoside-diphosphate-sugar epimerase
MHADALDREQVTEVLSKIDNQSIVVSLVGGQNAELAIRSDFPANKNIIEASQESGFSRFIFVTSIGSGESKPQLPEMLKPFLGPVAEEKTKAENVLRSSNLDYTIIRPGQLTNEPATGTGVLTEECILGSMSRDDLATMVMKAIEDDTTIGKIYSTLDEDKDLDFSWMKNR